MSTANSTVAGRAKTVAFWRDLNQCNDGTIDCGQPRLVHAIREPTMRRSQRNTLKQPPINLELLPTTKSVLVCRAVERWVPIRPACMRGLLKWVSNPTWIFGHLDWRHDTGPSSPDCTGGPRSSMRGLWSTIGQPADLLGQVGAWCDQAFRIFRTLPENGRKHGACRSRFDRRFRRAFSHRAFRNSPGICKESRDEVSLRLRRLARDAPQVRQFRPYINDGDVRFSALGAGNVRTRQIWCTSPNTQTIARAGALQWRMARCRQAFRRWTWKRRRILLGRRSGIEYGRLKETFGNASPRNALVFQVDPVERRRPAAGDWLDSPEKGQGTF